MSRPDPLNDPRWQALHRECSLLASLIGSAITSLGRASYGQNTGEYYVAFFGLSVGVERLAKLILVADHVLENAGQMPDASALRSYGHDINKLYDQVKKIELAHNLEIKQNDSLDDICIAIFDFLSHFADARRGRYANFDFADPLQVSEHDPLKKWWSSIIEVILERHFYGTQHEVSVTKRALNAEKLLGTVVSVKFINESGMWMNDIAEASLRTGITQFSQKYGRFYSLKCVRWLCNIFTELTINNGYDDRYFVLFGHHEILKSYRTEDKFLLTRKRWPL